MVVIYAITISSQTIFLVVVMSQNPFVRVNMLNLDIFRRFFYFSSIILVEIRFICDRALRSCHIEPKEVSTRAIMAALSKTVMRISSTDW